MDPQFIPSLKQKMLKAISVLQDDLSTIRTGRASSALVENVLITSYEGTQHLRLKEMATITTDGPKSIVISPFDPTVISDIERGINGANLGFSAVVDKGVVRISLPSLTAERRDEFIKLAHIKLEGGRIMIRQIRHEAMIDLKKKFEGDTISEDDKKRLEKDIQILTDEFMGEIEVLREKKDKELSEI